MPTHWVVYLSVADCAAALLKATSMGGSIVAPTMEIPNLGRIAKRADPQGASFAVVQVRR